MAISLLTIMAMIASAVAAVIGTAMFIVLMWQGWRRTENILMGAYMSMVTLWGGSTFASHFAAVVDNDATSSVYLSTVAVMIIFPTFFAFTTRYTGLWADPLIKNLSIGLAALGVILAIPTFGGVYVQDISVSQTGQTTYTLTAWGIIVLGIGVALHCVSVFLLIKRYTPRRKYILIGSVILLVSLLVIVFRPLGRYPLSVLAAAITAIYFTYSILRDNLFSPLAELNEELSVTNSRLQQVSEEARKSENSLRALIENTSDLIWSIDKSYRVVTLNSTAGAFFELVLNSYVHIGDHILAKIPPVNRPDWQRLYDQGLHGRRFSIERRYEVPLSGTHFYLEISFTPILDEREEIAGVSVFARDITRHKETEQELRRQALTFDNISDSIIITNLDGFITDCNPATEHVFGYTRDFLIGRNPEIWHVPEDRPYLGQKIVKAMEKHGRWEGEINFVHKDGSRGIVEAVALPLRDEKGDHIANIGVSRDITVRKKQEIELREAKEAAEAASKAKDEFLNSMSHELRTPLSAIIGYSEILEEDAQDHQLDFVTADVQKITKSARHLLDLINDVLALTRIESGKARLDINVINGQDFLDDLVLAVSNLMDQNENQFVADIADELGTWHTDAEKLKQILLNLLSNAAKFTKSGTITLAAKLTDNDLQLQVTDTGIGMSADILEFIFQPFTQADSSVTRRYGGTGLGLTICKNYCDLLQGSISVESTPGEGSTFTVQIPTDLRRNDRNRGLLTRLNADSHRSSEPVSALPGDGDTLTALSQVNPGTQGIVLIIEEDARVRDILVRHLYQQHYRVYTASSGEMGLRMARKLKPDTVLVDISLTDYGCWQILSVLKSDPLLAHIQVILSYLSIQRAQGIAFLTQDILAKPTDLNEIHSKIIPLIQSVEDEDTAGPVIIIESDVSMRAAIRQLIRENNEHIEHLYYDQIDPVYDLLDNLTITPRLIILDHTLLTVRDLHFFTLFCNLHNQKAPKLLISMHIPPTGDSTKLPVTSSLISKRLCPESKYLDTVSSLIAGNMRTPISTNS